MLELAKGTLPSCVIAQSAVPILSLVLLVSALRAMPSMKMLSKALSAFSVSDWLYG